MEGGRGRALHACASAFGTRGKAAACTVVPWKCVEWTAFSPPRAPAVPSYGLGPGCPLPGLLSLIGNERRHERGGIRPCAPQFGAAEIKGLDRSVEGK